MEEKLYPQIPNNIADDRERLETAIAKVDKQLETLLDLHLEGDIDRVTYQSRKNKLTARKQDLVNQLESKPISQASTEIKATLKLLRDQLKKATASKVYKILRLATEYLISSVSIAEMPPLDVLSLSEDELHKHYRSGRLARRDLEPIATPMVIARKYGHNHRFSRLDYNVVINWATGTTETLPVLEWTGWRPWSASSHGLISHDK